MHRCVSYVNNHDNEKVFIHPTVKGVWLTWVLSIRRVKTRDRCGRCCENRRNIHSTLLEKIRYQDINRLFTARRAFAGQASIGARGYA